ncbi:hypothetical protein DFQ30_009907 [Apophysomyces sp. BC1015]|nr:hypothetical protein DFQ30_009907 [Apophysomyces sp. BC1015]
MTQTPQKHGFQLTELTADKLKQLKRRDSFKKIVEQDIQFFQGILGAHNVLEKRKMSTDEYNKITTDWYNIFRGSPAVILTPESTEQVSDILKYCNDKDIAIVPQSGNTSASGGSVPVFDEIIVSTKKMNKIRLFDELRGDLVCDAGCVLQDLDNHLAQYGYQVPLDLPSRHLCCIGGNVSTNAGGIRQMRFGNLHSSVMGLEVVLPDGTVIDNLTTLRKDNTGYSLKDLFIGSEGTLGLVTGISISTSRIRSGIQVFLFAFSSFEDLIQTYVCARKELPETLSAFEMLDSDSVQCVRNRGHQHPRDTEFPISDKHKLYVVMETAGTDDEFEQKKAERLLKTLFDKKIIQDGAIAADDEKRFSFWSWRNMLPKAIVESGPSSIHFDVSLPLPRLNQLVEDTRDWALAEGLIGNDIVAVYGFGHVGDGNMHLSIPTLRDDRALVERIDDFVYEWTTRYHGSCSAEHGIGLMKVAYLPYTKSGCMISNMRKIKDLFDPKGIMNPYKLLPSKEQEERGEIVRKRSQVGC